MIRRMMRGLRVSLLLVLVTLLTSGCIFSGLLGFSASPNDDGTRTVSVSANSTLSPCQNENGIYNFLCLFLFGDVEEDSDVELNLGELILAILFFDPLILQVPIEASDFRGSYSFQDGDSGGDLVIITGLNSVRVDATRSLQAEPGMQLVIIDLPTDAPTAGTGAFNVNFKIPDDLTTLNLKALFTGKVTLNGETFYVPLLPCISDVTALPTITVPLPDGGDVALPVNEMQGCQDMVYTFPQAPQQFNTTMLLPMLAK